MHVLIADDDPGILQALELVLHRARITTARASSPAQVLSTLDSANQHFDAILLDLNYERDTTSGAEGLSLLSALKQRHPSLPAVVMTAWGSIEGAVEAMQRGAVDYVKKPWRNDKLLNTLRTLPSRKAAQSPQLYSSQSRDGESAIELLTRARSASMRQLQETLEQIAFSDLPVLITGEHGTGKELVARAVHEKSGRRGSFVPVHAGALAEGTCESELFGHVRGAFTDAKQAREGAFARAAEGTLFLDEIATMPFAQQAKLLRVLQQRQYQPVGGSRLLESTARVVSATNVDLDELQSSGAFRADLLYRLNAIQLHVPPLRERKEELAALSTYFLQREAKRHGVELPRLLPQSEQLLRSHDWPGNVRELEHTLQRALLLSLRTGTILPEHLQLSSTGLCPAEQPQPAEPPSSNGTLRDAEKAAIVAAMERFPNDRRAAAKSLGLSRSSFYRRLAMYGIQPWK